MWIFHEGLILRCVLVDSSMKSHKILSFIWGCYVLWYLVYLETINFSIYNSFWGFSNGIILYQNIARDCVALIQSSRHENQYHNWRQIRDLVLPISFILTTFTLYGLCFTRIQTENCTFIWYDLAIETSSKSIQTNILIRLVFEKFWN